MLFFALFTPGEGEGREEMEREGGREEMEREGGREGRESGRDLEV